MNTLRDSFCRIREVEALLLVVLLVLVFGFPSNLRASPDHLSDQPVWFSKTDYPTRCVAFGDLDLDGDLDLVCANDGFPITLWINDNGAFRDDNLELPGESRAFAIALADINKDGYLDLVCGNFGGKNTIYLNKWRKENQNKTFFDSLYWSSDLACQTMSVVVGNVDKDEDGYLDLVFGNADSVNTLYLNDHGLVAAKPVWSSDAIRATIDVALGDVDADGDLDLVCGNDGDVNTFYVNEWDRGNSRLFSDTPACTSESANRTFGVALGDIGSVVDGGPDGYLDVVCSNVNDVNTLYFYDGNARVFTRSTSWIPDREGVTTDVALGDIDLDGDLDLLFANDGETNALYVNEWSDGNQSVFSNAVGWESGPANGTVAIALGDVDGDGALELLCANASGDDRSNTLYENLGVPVDAGYIWESVPQNDSFGVALGDINDDGYLDAAFGNGQLLTQRNTIYENRGRNQTDWQMKPDSVFPENPTWEEDSAGSKTIGVALADFDGDGDLDLAAGNAGAPNTIRWNDGGQPGSEVWSSGDYAFTVTIVAGDVNGDGNLDLVCGNGGAANQKNALYLNTDDGRFSEVGAITWEEEESPGNATIGVALGDVDGDGDLDLVCGNNNAQSNTLYLNDGSDRVFEAKPVWESNFKRDTFGVALGDVDGDGDLDLVCGNAGTVDQANTLYLNNGGVFSLTPDWESELTGRSTFGVALADIDGDGDLDLACGNGGTDTERNTLYLNVGSPDYFTGRPVWESETADQTFGVAMGDVDEDGDVDLVFANAGTVGGRNRVYLCRKDPVFKGKPSVPECSTPNNAAHLVGVRLRPQINEDSSIINIGFAAIDVESDSVWIVPEYQYQGDPEWKSIEDARNAGLIGRLNTSPDGVVHDFDWDMLLLPFDPRPVVLRLRVVEVPQTVSVMRHIASYVKPIGPIAPVRPEIKVTPGTVAFPTVCQCGETSAVVTIANTGTKVLEVDTLVFQLDPGEKSAMTIEKDFPIYVEPGSGVDVEISFKPDPERVTPENVVVFSDDSITPQVPLEILTSVISLASTRIPDDPKVNSKQDVKIYILSLPDEASFVDGYLEYRAGGKRVWDDTLSLVDMPPPPTATIPGADVGSRGVQYRVTVNVALDGDTLTLTDPPCDPFIFLPVKVGGLRFPYGLPHDRYRMISIPLDLHDQPIVGVFDELGSPTPKTWRLWGYYDEHEDHHYRELPMYKKNFEQGRGYWLVTRNGGLRLNTSPAVGSTAPTDTAFVIHLKQSWNMIGNPFHFNVAWDAVRVGADSLTMEEALQQGMIERPRRWLHEKMTFQKDPARVLAPFDGYFVRSFVEELAIYIPPVEAPPKTTLVAAADDGMADGAGARANSKTDGGADTPGEWIVRIGVSSAGVTDPFNFIGVKEGARSAWDPNDLSEPPGPPGGLLSLYFPHNGWDHHQGCYTTDIRGDYQLIDAQVIGVASFSDDASGHVWNFDVATNLPTDTSGDEIHLDFSGVDQVPAWAKVILADRHLNKVIDLREQSFYDFYQANKRFVEDDADARFVVLVGGENFVDPETKDLRRIPTTTTLRSNYPNPFNPVTIVRYELARPARVTLRIYDVNGRLVKVLVDRNREPGYYEIGWNATNERGGPVSSGVYFYRFEADGVVQTRKMVFLK